jgi:hypothetical protein|tara:strand:- start:1254 stop:2885 length:1632 start_codon:yes stop_codon:yes gene_type:complete
MELLFAKYFAGYNLAYGQADMSRLEIDPITKKHKPTYRWNDEEATADIYKQHLTGEKSIGIQPCNESGLARFGVIDVDFKDYKNYDRKKFVEIIQNNNLPLIPVLSKSGGIHLYLFLDTFISAVIIRSFLSNLLPLFKLKHDTEIFPKQTKLVKDSETGKINKGNFINLPYFKKQERKAINTDGTEFSYEEFIKVIEANLVKEEDIKKITNKIEAETMDGVDDIFKDGPPCLAALSKVAKNDDFDGKDRFLYNYHVFVKAKYEDNWEQMVMDAPVKFFSGANAHAWDKQKLKAKLKSWRESYKGYTCTQSPINDFCKKGICVKRKFGVLHGSKGSYPVLTNLIKVDLEPEAEYTFDVTLPDGVDTRTVHCKTVEHVNDQRKRRNAISKYAGFPPPIIKGADDQQVLEDLYRTLTVQDPPIGTTPKEKLHDQLHQKINGARAQNDVSFKSGGVLIDGEFAYFKFVNFYNKLKSNGWKYPEDKTGIMIQEYFEKCDVEFIEEKRFPSQKKGEYNTPTKHLLKISTKKFEQIKILHNKINYDKEII